MTDGLQRPADCFSLVTEETGFQYFSFASRDFASREEARVWIRRLSSRTNPLHPGESRAPRYVVAEVGGESFCDAQKRARGVEW